MGLVSGYDKILEMLKCFVEKAGSRSWKTPTFSLASAQIQIQFTPICHIKQGIEKSENRVLNACVDESALMHCPLPPYPGYQKWYNVKLPAKDSGI